MVHVGSDVARLRRVIIQRPGAAHARMLPKHIEPGSPDYLLFDDLVHVPQARQEHDQLRAVLSTAAEVAQFEDLVVDVLAKDAARTEILADVERLEVAGAMVRRLGDLEPAQLAEALMAGGLPGEPSFLPPLPNLIFTRDLAAVVGSLLIVGNASKAARRRESVLTWAMVDHHPWFEAANVSRNCRRVRGARSWPLTVEGGDVLVLSDSIALIGASERTSWSMIVSLAHELVEHGMRRILVVEMAKQRSSMHLDTVFTLCDTDTCVVYPPLLEAGGREEVHITRLEACENGRIAVDPIDGDLLQALAAEGHPMRAIPCGGDDPTAQRREQWTDGANYMAISPGVVVGYARNERTAAAMSEAGFRVVDAKSFLREFERDFREDYDELVASGRRYAVQIIGPELCRGRGGPRCLTLPVERG